MSDHMKRLAAPKMWPLKRKESVWATKPSAGAHPLKYSLSATSVLRDLAGVCDTAREAKRIIGNRELLVDGKAVKNPKAPVGVMDVVSIPKMGLNYRMLISDKGKLKLVPITEDEATWKICRIEDKTLIKGGKFQLNLSGGRNILLDKNEYKTGDSLKVDVKENKILDCFELKNGASILIVEGSQAGRVDTVDDCVVVRGPASNVVKFTSGTETTRENVFVIGASKPEITLPEASE